ncbi:hypothetical protein RI129_001503 [Pyrocoelia pectoralis]|uniref:Transposase n=1 Tax=Pyrocoelia pectoralis TaxID=417401 RepID=A0AAN7VVP5_9COLE
MAEVCDVSIFTVSERLKKIGKVKKLEKWIPHDLNERQKFTRFEICSSQSLRNKKDPLLDRIVTSDGKWIMYDKIKRCGQWLTIDDPPKHFPKAKIAQKKVMLTVWYIPISATLDTSAKRDVWTQRPPWT